jgi:hypothetical protein
MTSPQHTKRTLAMEPYTYFNLPKDFKVVPNIQKIWGAPYFKLAIECDEPVKKEVVNFKIATVEYLADNFS